MDGPQQYMVWYHAVGLIWISEFILACQQMTVAGAVVTYYFTRSDVTIIVYGLQLKILAPGNHMRDDGI